jgi:hypothetical protein
MRGRLIQALIVAACTIWSVSLASAQSLQQVTLYAVWKYDQNASRSLVNFQTGERGASTLSSQRASHLIYGCLTTDKDPDWFATSVFRTDDDRSRLIDIGAHKWTDAYKVPVVIPREPVAPGTHRQLTLDFSGLDAPRPIYGVGKDGYPELLSVIPSKKKQVNPEGYFVKEVLGHMYALHIKDTDTDLYIVFRVDAVVPGDNVTISWKSVPSPRI